MRALTASALVLFVAVYPGSADTGADARLKRAFALSGSERVAVIGIGDSNQRFGGHGYSEAMAKAFYREFGCYGSGLMLYQTQKDPASPRELPVAPAELSNLLLKYWYIPPGGEDRQSWRNGQLIIPADHPLDVKGPLRFHFTYGTFLDADSTYQPSVRMDAPPWKVIKKNLDPVHCGPALWGLAKFTMDLERDADRSYPIQFMPSEHINAPISGPFLAASAQCENTEKKSGTAFSTLYGTGGQSLRDMLAYFQEIGEVKLENYFRQIREALNGGKSCIVMITSGLNDRSERSPSIGPSGGLQSSHPDGYSDNLEGITATLQEAWVKAGGTPESIHFALMPSHVLAEPDDQRLVSYREAAAALAGKLPNASLIDLSELVPYGEMEAGKYYDKGAATSSHLTPAGYEAIANAMVKQLRD